MTTSRSKWLLALTPQQFDALERAAFCARVRDGETEALWQSIRNQLVRTRDMYEGKAPGLRLVRPGEFSE